MCLISPWFTREWLYVFFDYCLVKHLSFVTVYFVELRLVILGAVLTGSAETLARYFSGTVDPSTQTSSCCLLSAFLTWYNVPHPKALAQMGLTGGVTSAYLYYIIYELSV